MAERARVVQEAFEDRQATTAETLDKLLREVEANEARKAECDDIEQVTALVNDL